MVFISGNTSSNAWKCPVCNKYTQIKDLVFDSFFEKILSMTVDVDSEKSSLSVELFADATWKLMDDCKAGGDKEDDGKSDASASVVAASKILPIITLDSDEDIGLNSLLPAVSISNAFYSPGFTYCYFARLIQERVLNLLLIFLVVCSRRRRRIIGEVGLSTNR